MPQKTVLAIVAVALAFAGCGGNSGSASDPYDAYSTSGDISSATTPQALAVSTSGNVELSYSLNIGSTAKEIYLVFSNPSGSASDTATLSGSVLGSSTETSASVTEISTLPVILKDHPALLNMKKIPLVEKTGTSSILKNSAGSASGDAAGETGTFHAVKTISNIDYKYDLSATCRYVSGSVSTPYGTKVLNIWVADNCYGTTSTKGTYTVTDAMISAFASKFLTDGSSDIYSLVTGIYGEEWGYSKYSNLIDYNDEITILLLDIDEDDSINGGTIGYFNPDDCYTTASSSTSNARLMFYIDAVLLATPEGTWDIADHWPSEMVSTLAHEFQHMVHFYQKYVLRGANSDTWLNEMCSMMAEDLVADKIAVDGPRGVTYSNYSAGSAGNSTGRISDFISNTKLPLFTWSGDVDSYGESYAFGAFIGRNFGGAPLFRSIVQSSYTGSDAVTYALSQQTNYSSETFATVFAKWGAAMLLSDSTSAPSTYQYNKEGAFTSNLTINGTSTTFNLGSINAYKYIDGSQTGPKFYTSLSSALNAGETILYRAGNLSGTQSWTLHLPSTVKLTVVAK